MLRALAAIIFCIPLFLFLTALAIHISNTVPKGDPTVAIALLICRQI